MSLSFAQQVSIPDHVMFRELEGEAVLLDLDSENYFGLNAVATCMWQRVTGGEPIQQAYNALLGEFDVDAETLRRDLSELLDELISKGLLEVHGDSS